MSLSAECWSSAKFNVASVVCAMYFSVVVVDVVVVVVVVADCSGVQCSVR